MLSLGVVLFFVLQKILALQTSYNTADYLSNVDDIIMSQLNHPDTEESKYICSSIERYNYMLEQVLIKLKEKNPKITKVVQDLWAKGRPKFADFSGFSKIKLTYRWGKLNIDHFFRLITNTDKLWQKFKLEYENNIDM